MNTGTRNTVIAYSLIALIIIAAALPGCAAFNRLVNENEFTMQLATEAATARVLHEHPFWKWQVISITDDALLLIDAKKLVELGDVENYIKGKIHWTAMMPEEQALVSALISQVSKNIEDTLRSKNVTNPWAKLVEVRKVLGWINAVAKRQATIGG